MIPSVELPVNDSKRQTLQELVLEFDDLLHVDMYPAAVTVKYVGG
jgi:hypothetical protein